MFKILFILLLVIQIFLFIKSVKSKSNKDWLTLFTIIISSGVSVVLLWCYSLANEKDSSHILMNLVLCIFSAFVYIVILLIALITKIMENSKKKKENIYEPKMEKAIIKKSIVVPFLIISLLSIGLCITDYVGHTISEKKEMKEYNQVKEKELDKMVDFINDKYNMSLNISDCVYYREEDYSRHSDVFGNGKDYNIPYIGVFEVDNQKITVADRKGYISDNKQLMDINKMLSEYFKEKTQIDFDFVEISKSYVGSYNGDDNVINKVLQTKYNNLITNVNISEFLDCILEEEDLSIKFYVRDTAERDKLIEDITMKLSYLREYQTIEIIEVIGYDSNSELVVDTYTCDFDDEDLHGNTSDDYSDSYKFGNYYISNDENEYVFSMRMKLDRGYDVEEGEVVNNWVVRKIEEKN